MGHTKLDAVALEAATMALLRKETNPAPTVDWLASRDGTVTQWKERVYYAITAYLDAAQPAPADTREPVAWHWHEPASEWNGYEGRERVTLTKPKPSEARLGCTPLFR